MGGGKSLSLTREARRGQNATRKTYRGVLGAQDRAGPQPASGVGGGCGVREARRELEGDDGWGETFLFLWERLVKFWGGGRRRDPKCDGWE